MDNIENIIKQVCKNDIQIPAKIENRINYALKTKSIQNQTHYLRNFITAIISILCTLIGGLSVYAAFGGTISGKPVIHWLGFNISNNYDKYKETVVDQQVSYNETTIDLISTVCDEGFTIFEFDVKVSDTDKKHLRLNENIITEEYIELLKKEYENSDNKRLGIPFEETLNYEIITENKDVKNTIELSFENETKDQKIHNIFIDGKGYYAKTFQTTNKITDNEYKVYQLYLLTDEILEEKKEFKVELKNIVLKNTAEQTANKSKHSFYLANTPDNEKSISIKGKVTTNVSKKKLAQNSKLIESTHQTIKYKKMTEKIEKISITPMQTVIKISQTYKNISLRNLCSSQDKNHISFPEYIAKDSNNNEIPSISTETKRTITYFNGRKEDWAPGDIGTYKDFSNATLETIQYLVIEQRNDLSTLKIISNIKEIKDDMTTNSKKIGEYNIKLK